AGASSYLALPSGFTDISRPAIRRLLIGTPTPRGGLRITCRTSNLKSGWPSSALAWSQSIGRLGSNDLTEPHDRGWQSDGILSAAEHHTRMARGAKRWRIIRLQAEKRLRKLPRVPIDGHPRQKFAPG